MRKIKWRTQLHPLALFAVKGFFRQSGFGNARQLVVLARKIMDLDPLIL